MRPFNPIVNAAGALALFAGALAAQDEALVPVRDWTSADGKVLSASLIGFEKGQGQFRTPEGRRFVIPDDRLSLRDQVEVFVARLTSQCEVIHSADINTDFYYSKHVPANRRFEKNYAYVAFGPGRFNLAIAFNEPGVDFSRFKEIVVRGADDSPLAVHAIPESGIRRVTRNGKERTYARISFVVGQNEDILEAVEEGLAADALTFVARGEDVPDLVIELDEPEANGLREMVSAYRQASKLIQEGFLRRDRLANRALDAVGDPAGEAPGGDPLEPFRKGLSKQKYGTLQWKSETVDGVGFLGTDVVVRQRDGKIARAPFAEISEEGRTRLFEKRMKEAFGRSRHVYNNTGNTVFLHPDWDSRRMMYSRSILLVRDTDGRYLLRAFAWAGNLNGTPVEEIRVRGDLQETPFLLACRPDESDTRERTDGALNTVVATYLDAEAAASASALIGSRSIQFRIRSAQNQDASAALQEDELHATLESVSLYHWTRHL